MTPSGVFLHVYCGGHGWWRAILDELLDTLERAQIPAPLYAGLVGVDHDEAAGIVTGRGATVLEVRTQGWEHVTLEALHRFCTEEGTENSAVLYLHTKGAYDHQERSDLWRRSMAYHVIHNWAQCVNSLDEGADAVGCHYLSDPGGGPPSHFQGNFWWARSAFVASLPALDYTNRYGAEFWVGRSPGPRTVLDLCPGGFDPAIDHDSGPCAHGRGMIRDEAVRVVG